MNRFRSVHKHFLRHSGRPVALKDYGMKVEILQVSSLQFLETGNRLPVACDGENFAHVLLQSQVW